MIGFPLIDAHADTIGRFLEKPERFFDATGQGHSDGQRLVASGMNVQVMAVYTPPEKTGPAALRYALDFLGAVQALLASPRNLALENPFTLITNRAELDEACRPGRRGLLVFLEGASPLCGDIKNLEVFRRLGVRGLTITHNHDNEAGGGCFATGASAGLSPFGRELVAALEEANMAVDLAHANERLFRDVLATASKPLIDSHTGLRSFLAGADPRLLARALSDEQLAALAATGGAACIDFVPEHLALPAAGQKIGIAEVLAVLRGMVEIAGVDRVGIGGDWDGFPGAVEGLEDVTRLPAFGEALLENGFSRNEAGKIMGGNLYRVFSDILD